MAPGSETPFAKLRQGAFDPLLAAPPLRVAPLPPSGVFANVWQKFLKFAKYWQISGARHSCRAGLATICFEKMLQPSWCAESQKNLSERRDGVSQRDAGLKAQWFCVELRQQSWGTSGQVRTRNFAFSTPAG
jgi:hypothetical protein